jgi:hypothetical protein
MPLALLFAANRRVPGLCMRVFRVLMAILLMIALLPVFSMAAAEVMAQFYGCKLDLAGAHPCIVGDRDIGHALLTLGMMGYFLFATMPFIVGIVAVWLLAEIIRWARSRSLAG